MLSARSFSARSRSSLGSLVSKLERLAKKTKAEINASARRGEIDAVDKDTRFVWKTFDNIKKDKTMTTKPLAKGGNAAVFKTCDKKTKKCLVIKPRCSKYEACVRAEEQGRDTPSLHDVRADEARVSEKLNMVSSNFVKTFVATGKKEGSILAMEAVEPWKKDILSLRSFFKKFSANKKFLPAILFQVVFALAKAQKAFPGFRHNDLHWENVTLTKWGGEMPTYKVGSRCYRLPPGSPRVVIIDFGWVTQQARRGGLGASTTWDIVKNREYGNPSMFAMDIAENEWFDFVTLLLWAPRRFRVMDAFKISGVSNGFDWSSFRSTQVNRPTFNTQRNMQRAVRAGRLLTMKRWLETTPMFEGLRGPCRGAVTPRFRL